MPQENLTPQTVENHGNRRIPLRKTLLVAAGFMAVILLAGCATTSDSPRDMRSVTPLAPTMTLSIQIQQPTFPGTQAGPGTQEGIGGGLGEDTPDPTLMPHEAASATAIAQTTPVETVNPGEDPTQEGTETLIATSVSTATEASSSTPTRTSTRTSTPSPTSSRTPTPSFTPPPTFTPSTPSAVCNIEDERNGVNVDGSVQNVQVDINWGLPNIEDIPSDQVASIIPNYLNAIGAQLLLQSKLTTDPSVTTTTSDYTNGSNLSWTSTCGTNADVLFSVEERNAMVEPGMEPATIHALQNYYGLSSEEARGLLDISGELIQAVSGNKNSLSDGSIDITRSDGTSFTINLSDINVSLIAQPAGLIPEQTAGQGEATGEFVIAQLDGKTNSVTYPDPNWINVLSTLSQTDPTDTDLGQSFLTDVSLGGGRNTTVTSHPGLDTTFSSTDFTRGELSFTVRITFNDGNSFGRSLPVEFTFSSTNGDLFLPMSEPVPIITATGEGQGGNQTNGGGHSESWSTSTPAPPIENSTSTPVPPIEPSTSTPAPPIEDSTSTPAPPIENSTSTPAPPIVYESSATDEIQNISFESVENGNDNGEEMYNVELADDQFTEAEDPTQEYSLGQGYTLCIDENYAYVTDSEGNIVNQQKLPSQPVVDRSYGPNNKNSTQLKFEDNPYNESWSYGIFEGDLVVGRKRKTI